MKWRWGGPIYSFTTSDIQRKVISTRIVSSPRFPLSAPQQINEWAAHTNPTSFWVQTWKQRGNVKRSALGECSPLEKDTRVETANEGRLSSQICSERVDGGSTIKLTHQGTSHTTNFTKSRWIQLSETSLAHFHFNCSDKVKRINQSKLALASTPFLWYIYHKSLKLGIVV